MKGHIRKRGNHWNIEEGAVAENQIGLAVALFSNWFSGVRRASESLC